MHSNYDPVTLDYDIALIKLTTPLTFESDNKIAPVCLPPSGSLYVGVDAIVTGWGALSSGIITLRCLVFCTRLYILKVTNEKNKYDNFQEVLLLIVYMR